MPHLCLVPALHVAAVLVSDGLILRSDIGQDSSHVGLRLGVHLNVHGAGRHLVAQDCELLKAERERTLITLEKVGLVTTGEPGESWLAAKNHHKGCCLFVFFPPALTSAWFFFR